MRKRSKDSAERGLLRQGCTWLRIAVPCVGLGRFGRAMRDLAQPRPSTISREEVQKLFARELGRRPRDAQQDVQEPNPESAAAGKGAAG